MLVDLSYLVLIQYSSALTVRRESPVRVDKTSNHYDINNKQPLGVVAEEKQVVVPLESTVGKLCNVKIEDDPSNDRSIESDTDSPVWAESQDWRPAFFK
jgi:hypothetical protein